MHRNVAPRSVTRTVRFENLETRTLFSGMDYDGASTLNITGTTGSDTIELDVTDWPSVRDWHLELNGEPDSVQSPLITHVNILGDGGNDKIKIVGLPPGVFAKVFTGSGNDSLTVEEMSVGDV